MKRVTVVIKGNVAEAVLAANERAIVLYEVKPSYALPGNRFQEVLALVDPECKPELHQWFNAYESAKDHPAPAGTLLWFGPQREPPDAIGYIAGNSIGTTEGH